MLNFHQLRLFFEVAQCGSFSRAANKLNISQPAVSAQIREFEIELGLQLFERSSKKLFLTEAGRTVERYAGNIFGLADEIQRAVTDLKGLSIGRLSLAASTTVGECILPEALGRFKSAYSGITLELQINNTTRVAEWVINRKIDLGFVGDRIESPELEVEPLCQDEIVVFSSITHPFALRSSVSVEELENEPFVTREQGSATRHNAEKEMQNSGVIINTIMELGSNEAVKRAVGAGLGLGMLSRFSLVPEVKAGMLKIITVDGLRITRNFTTIYRKDKELTRAEKRFLEIVRESVPLVG